MFKPVNFIAKLFKAYLKMIDHPGKIRIQNWIGRNIFKKGILFKNEEATYFKLNANDWITRIFLMEGSYEMKSVALAKKIMQEGSVFVDIGSNFGLYGCQINALNNNVQTLAVDANYKILPALVENIRLNKQEKNISIYNIAVTNDFGLVMLEQPALDNLGTTQTREGSGGFLNVGSCSLGSLLNHTNLKKVSLLKIDIEGNEFEVFKNFDFSKFKIENILLEFNHLSNISFEDLRSFFNSKNFKCYSINGIELQSAEDEIPENNIWLVNQNITD